MSIAVRNIVLFVAFMLPGFLAAQSVRDQIDAERGSDSFLDKKIMDQARNFIRKDSTYYLGHFFQGGFMFFRANDKLGFTMAIEPLQKAFRLIEKDYDRQLRTRTNSYATYNEVYRFHSDYGFIAYMLEQCYQNVEMPDKAIEVLTHVKDRNFQIEQGIDAYNTMAWIYHRNRIYTSQQFPFLKNSVKDNVTMATKLLDSALLKISNDNPVNMGLFDASYLNRRYLSTYHYMAMIYDYKLEIDSANLYYDELIRNHAYSSNNYAEFKLAMGELGEADQYFKEAEEREYGVEKQTKEYFYMRGTLDIYRGHPEEADTLLLKVLNEQGSTPGYGWHCIGLSRAQHYEGLTEESQKRSNKAARFQELHIGTTWGQEQYNMAVASLNYVNQLQFKREYLFENDQWWFWFNPVNWYKWISYSISIHEQKLILNSLVAENSEREQVIYSIFASENLMSFDEVQAVIDGIGNEYFIGIYKKMLEQDKRPQVKKYIRYFLGKLYLAEGEKSEATRYFEEVLREAGNDEYQTMLVARALEGLAEASSNSSSRNEWMMKFYDAYPQLVPFSRLQMKFNLDVSGDINSKLAEDMLADMKNCQIDFVSDTSVPTATIRFRNNKDGVDIDYSVHIPRGRQTVSGTLRVNKEEADNAGKLLAYRLFGINKTVIGEQPEAIPTPPAEVGPKKEKTVV